MNDDTELLRRYVEEGAEAAFAEWVQRHLGLVYAAALRRLGGDTHGAAEVARGFSSRRHGRRADSRGMGA